MNQYDSPLPHSPDAEKAVAGACLIDPEAIKRISWLQYGDFLNKSYGAVFQAVRRLDEDKINIDYLTVKNILDANGWLERIGGETILGQLINDTPTALHVEDYAHTVADDSMRRRTIQRGAAMVKTAHDRGIPLSQLQQEAAEISEQMSVERTDLSKPTTMKELMSDTIDQVSYRKNHPGLSGITTPITELNELTDGLQKGDLVLIGGRPGMGKCLGKGTQVVMADGTLQKVEDLSVGQQLLGPDSLPRTVLSTAVGYDEMYLVKQRHGVDYRVNQEHILSLKRSKAEGKHKHGEVASFCVRDAQSKGAGFFSRWKGYKVAIELPKRPVPLSPYFLGLWLGDGKQTDSRIYTTDKEIVEFLNSYAEERQEYISIGDSDNECHSYRITGGRSQPARDRSVGAQLRKLGVLGEKHIPDVYLYNCREVRLRLLAGLIDSDGHYPKNLNGPYEITQKRRVLACQIKQLCDSLGYRTSFTTKRAQCQTGAAYDVYRVRFNGDVDEIPVQIKYKKAPAWSGNCDWQVTGISIKPDGKDFYYGFELDGDGLFLLEDMTVTHNSALAFEFCMHQAKAGHRALFFSIEMNKARVGERLLSRAMNVPSQILRRGGLAEDEWPNFFAQADALAKYPIKWDFSPIQDPASIEASLMSAVLDEGGVDIVYLDHLGLVSFYNEPLPGRAPQKYTPRIDPVRALGAITRRCRALARIYNFVFVILTQLSRAVEGRRDKRPVPSDIRGSGEIEQNGDLILFPYRPNVNDPAADPALCELIVGKQRNGPTGMCPIGFDAPTGAFRNPTSSTATEPIPGM